MRRVRPEKWAFVPTIGTIPEGGAGGAIDVPVGPGMDPPSEPFFLPFIDKSLDPVGEVRHNYNFAFTVRHISIGWAFQKLVLYL